MNRTQFEGYGEFLVPTEGCHKIPLSLYKNVRSNLVARANKAGLTSGVILHQAGKETTLYDTDAGQRTFRQESYFAYLFGVEEADFYGVIDLSTGKSTLFCPNLPESYSTWLGQIYPPEFFTKKYGVDETLFVDDLPATFEKLKPSTVYVIEGPNSDSGLIAKPAHFDGLEKFNVDKNTLFAVIANARVFKTKEEQDVLRYSCKGSSLAHVKAMQAAKPGIGEHQLESIILHEAFFSHGLKHQGYTCIVGSGIDTAVLHYICNNKRVKDGSLVLIDAGCEYNCYTADITTSWPVNGKFTEKQKAIYDLVLQANQTVLNKVKPGVDWKEMHRLSYEIIGAGLVKLGILKGDVKELIENDIVYMFMPHGLGHFLGLAVHDVGGYLPETPARETKPGFKNLRAGRVLEKDMVTTVEPGCYFNQALITAALADENKAKYFNTDKIKEYMDFGGVRIEENIIITDDGCEVMTSVPRTTAEIEAVMAGGNWEAKPTFYKN